MCLRCGFLNGTGHRSARWADIRHGDPRSKNSVRKSVVGEGPSRPVGDSSHSQSPKYGLVIWYNQGWVVSEIKRRLPICLVRVAFSGSMKDHIDGDIWDEDNPWCLYACRFPPPPLESYSVQTKKAVAVRSRLVKARL